MRHIAVAEFGFAMRSMFALKTRRPACRLPVVPVHEPWREGVEGVTFVRNAAPSGAQVSTGH
jgi:hypothetical protein